MKRHFALLPLLLVLAGARLGADEGHHHEFDPNEKLGTVKFPVSCADRVQKPFERGVALLHSFWYERAEEQFEAILASDPACAMAYWGEAMSLYHQLWERPDPKTLARGQSLVQKGQQLAPRTPRERGYLAALLAFYRENDSIDHPARAVAYANAMEKLYGANPKDHEAGAFYALALLASAPPRDTTFTNQRKAIEILDRLFEQEPEHPGIPHYIIHSCDTPSLAPLGLKAARRYAKVAPSSPHALHMPGHIFARLGLWPEDIESNLASVAAAEKSGATGHALHALDFLNYAYLQVGEAAKARAAILRLDAMPGMEGHDMADYLGYAKAQFPATYALEMRSWSEALKLEAPPGVEPFVAALTDWARAVGAGHLRDAAAVRQALEHYDTLVEATKQGAKAYRAESMDLDRDEIRAWLAFAQGNGEEAVARMRAVADRQDAQGKQEVQIPAREMLADMLLELSRPEEALVEYEAALKVDPNRFNGLYGAARAAELASRPEKASAYYAQLLDNCGGASAERAELAHARAQAPAKTSDSRP